MSTHSGAINSLAASTTHDLYLPLTRQTRRRSPAAFRAGRALHARLGRRADRRRAAVPAAGNARRGRRAGDRVVHLRRPAWRILPWASGGGAQPSAMPSRAWRSVSRPCRSSCSRGRSPRHSRHGGGAGAIGSDHVAMVRADRHVDHAGGGHAVVAHTPGASACDGRHSRSDRPMRIVVGVDGGGSRTRAVVADEQRHEHRNGRRRPERHPTRGRRAISGRHRRPWSRTRWPRPAAGTRTDRALRRRRGRRAASPSAMRSQRALVARGLADDVVVQPDAIVALDDAFGDGAGHPAHCRHGIGGLRSRADRHLRAAVADGARSAATKAAARGSGAAR